MHGGITVKLFSGEVSATGNTHSTPYYVLPFKEGNFFLNVTAKAGTTPTIDVVVESKDPSADKWHTIATFTQIGDTIGSEMKPVAANLGKNIAIKYTLGGSNPVYTFTVYAVLKVF